MGKHLQSVPSYKEWDSNFFGFPIGTVLLPRDVSVQALRHKVKEWCALGFDLVYVFADEPLGVGISETLASCGAKAFGTRVVYRKEYQQRVALGDDRCVCVAFKKTLALECLAHESGACSRFNLDDRLKPFFKRLFGVWLDRELKSGRVFVFPNGDSPVGMVTASLETVQTGRIGLVAVDAGWRGEGVASRLLSNVDAWLAEKGALSCEVVTQGANMAARALYEKAGFRQVSETAVWHLWS